MRRDPGRCARGPFARRISVMPSRTLRSLHRARVGGDVLVEPHDRALALQHLPARERVVGDDQSALRQARQHLVVVVDVAFLIRVDEDEVEVAVEAADRLERRSKTCSVMREPCGLRSK